MQEDLQKEVKDLRIENERCIKMLIKYSKDRGSHKAPQENEDPLNPRVNESLEEFDDEQERQTRQGRPKKAPKYESYILKTAVRACSSLGNVLSNGSGRKAVLTSRLAKQLCVRLPSTS